MKDCIFCQIAKNESLSHKIWEDDEFLAILNIFPNTKGTSLVIPKEHYSSYFADVPEELLDKLIRVSRKVAKQLDEAFEDVGRTGMIFEGFGVDHLHSKLYPMHGTVGNEWKMRESDMNKYFETYEGYISSHSSIRAEDSELKKLAKEIRKYAK